MIQVVSNVYPLFGLSTFSHIEKSLLHILHFDNSGAKLSCSWNGDALDIQISTAWPHGKYFNKSGIFALDKLWSSNNSMGAWGT